MKYPMASSWIGLVAEYQTLRSESYTAQLRRAQFLRALRDEEPWKSRKMFETDEEARRFARMDFDMIIRRLGDNTVEVHNTMRVLDHFGDEKFGTVGRDNLLRVMNRISGRKDQERVIDTFEERLGGFPAKKHDALRLILDEMSSPRLLGARVPFMRAARAEGELERLRRIVAECPKCSAKLAKRRAKGA